MGIPCLLDNINCSPCCIGAGSGISLGVMPPAGDISWMATIASSVPGVTPQTGLTRSAGSTPMVAPAVAPVAPSIVVMPAGGYMGEGLLPIPERLEKKIVALEFVEMRDLMPETWLREEEESASNTLSLPRRRTAPVTNILQWLQCYAGMVGVLSQSSHRWLHHPQ